MQVAAPHILVQQIGVGAWDLALLLNSPVMPSLLLVQEHTLWKEGLGSLVHPEETGSDYLS